MIKLLRADLIRLRKSFAFRLSLVGMLVLSTFFMLIQATAMDYTVPLSRVIFLPMSMYGVAMAAFVGVFVGTDFSDGFVRNKLLTVRKRSDFVFSQVIVSCVGCLIVYIIVTAFTTGIGRFYFENDVDGPTFCQFFIIGIGMSLFTGCLFSAITLFCGNKTHAIIWCMGLAFGMLFLSMHTNEILVQTKYKEGVLNPHYVSGIRRTICSILHDINPCGQAAQLSSWKVLYPIRASLINLLMISVTSVLGCMLFARKDIK